MKADLPTHARSPVTLRLPEKHKMRVTLLPPLTCEARKDIHALVDVSKAADVVLLCLHTTQRSGKHSTQDGVSIDHQGALALQVLRSMGLPEVMVAVQGAGSSLKERAAARKQATAALECDLPGDRKVLPPQLPCPCSTFPILQPSHSRILHACLLLCLHRAFLLCAAAQDCILEEWGLYHDWSQHACPASLTPLLKNVESFSCHR